MSNEQPVGNLSVLTPLTTGHDVARFSSGSDSIDDYLKEMAKTAQDHHIASTLVVADDEMRVWAYCTLAVKMISNRNVSPRRVRDVTIREVPSYLLARLGRHKCEATEGIGATLVKRFFEHCVEMHDHQFASGHKLPISFVSLDAANDDLTEYYRDLGFFADKDKEKPLSMVSTIQEVKAAIALRNIDKT